MKGRKKKPTALRLVDGTLRTDRHGNPEAEPQYAAYATMPPAPNTLGEQGRKMWADFGGKLAAAGLITDGCLNSFETYCRTYDEVAACDAVVEKEGRTVLMPGGGIKIHPCVNERFKWLELRKKYETEFGLTPSTKSGLQVDNPKSEAGVVSRKRG